MSQQVHAIIYTDKQIMLNLQVNVVIIPYRYAVLGVHPGPGIAVEIQKKDIIQHPHDDIMLLKLPKPVTDIKAVAHIKHVVLPTCKDKNNNLNKKPEK